MGKKWPPSWNVIIPSVVLLPGGAGMSIATMPVGAWTPMDAEEENIWPCQIIASIYPTLKLWFYPVNSDPRNRLSTMT